MTLIAEIEERDAYCEKYGNTDVCDPRQLAYMYTR
jgi:hypothetical protein